MSEGEETLAALARILDQLSHLLGLGFEHYSSEASARLSVQRLWIAAGEAARRYCEVTDTDTGVEPWSSLWAYRNFLAHHLPDEISDDRVWLESVRDLVEYRSVLEGPLGGGNPPEP